MITITIFITYFLGMFLTITGFEVARINGGYKHTGYNYHEKTKIDSLTKIHEAELFFVLAFWPVSIIYLLFCYSSKFLAKLICSIKIKTNEDNSEDNTGS